MNRWDELNDPSYVKDGDTQENSSLYSFGVPVTVGVVVMRVRGGTMVSKTRTVHARGNLKAQITDESVLYLKDNKKETNAWFQACGINVPLGGTQLGVIRSIDFNGSIAQNAENVNSGNKSVRWSLNNLSKDAAIHYNDKNRASDFVKDLGLQLPAIFKDIQDSDVIVRDIGVNVNKEIENVTQSQQFKRWFGDWQNDPENASKVVNANGKDGSNPDIRLWEKPMTGLRCTRQAKKCVLFHSAKEKNCSPKLCASSMQGGRQSLHATAMYIMLGLMKVIFRKMYMGTSVHRSVDIAPKSM